MARASALRAVAAAVQQPGGGDLEVRLGRQPAVERQRLDKIDGAADGGVRVVDVAEPQLGALEQNGQQSGRVIGDVDQQIADDLVAGLGGGGVYEADLGMFDTMLDVCKVPGD